MTTNDSQFCHSIHDNMDELKQRLGNNTLLYFVINSIIAKITPLWEDVLLQMDSLSSLSNRDNELAKTIVKEMISPKYCKGDTIPKIMHHFWAGNQLSHIAMGNLFYWIEETQKYEWNHILWTDSNVNALFADTILQE